MWIAFLKHLFNAVLSIKSLYNIQIGGVKYWFEYNQLYPGDVILYSTGPYLNVPYGVLRLLKVKKTTS
jgi:hypothetical protein